MKRDLNIFKRSFDWSLGRYMTFWITIILICMSPMWVSGIQWALFSEEIVIEGEVTKVRITDEHLYLSFNNETTEYKIDYPIDNVDFTVNSKIIIKLHNSASWTNTNHVWTYMFIKVPETL